MEKTYTDFLQLSPFGDLIATHTYTNHEPRAASHESYAYDMFGNRTATTNALGNVIHRSYDSIGNLTAEWGATYPVRYTYDTQGRRTSLSTTRDGETWDTTSWAYDPRTGNCLSKTYADGSTVTYTYTPDNLPLRTTYASGRWKENVYDEHRQVVAVEYSDGETVSLAYDAFSNEIAASNGVAFANLDRDAKGNCTNDTTVVGDEVKTTRRTFDAFNRLTGIDGTSYDYNADGLLASVSNAIAVVEYAYTPDHLDAGYSLTLSNGVVFARSTLRDGCRRSLVTSISSIANGVGVGNLAYTYDALNRPTARNNDTFGYNARSEVTAANVSGVPAAYGYDEIGNSTNWTANCLNQYTEFTYDPDGNMTQCGDWTYTYDAANRLKTVSSNGVLLVTNFYDTKSRRVKKVTPEATTTFFYDDWNLIEERVAYTNGTSSTIRYFWGKDLSGTLQGAGGVGGLLYLTVDGTIYIPCHDNNGNISRYLDANGNTVTQYTYDAFGKTIFQSGPLADFLRHRFSTKYFDAELDLYYYGYRFYHPGIMRWLNRDTLEEVGGVDIYAFVNNNPVSVSDGFGESPYIIGEQEPPRRTVLSTGTWNTLPAPTGAWWIRVRAKLTVIGGRLRSMPDASRHLQHFLDNSGTPLEIRFEEMNRESAQARFHFERELRDALSYAERLVNSDGRSVIVTASESSSGNNAGNWLFAVGQYTTWARASVVKCGNSYSMNWHFYFRDIYDWELDNDLGGGLVADREMALLHRYGLAREYEMNGRQFISVDWKKGQQLNSGARVSGL